MILMHSNDLLDHRIIEKGCFVPNITIGSVIQAVNEMIDLMKTTIVDRNIHIDLISPIT